MGLRGAFCKAESFFNYKMKTYYCFLFCLIWYTLPTVAQQQINIDWTHPLQPVFSLSGIPQLAGENNNENNKEQAQTHLTVHRIQEGAVAEQPVAGKYHFRSDSLFFQPHLPLNPNCRFVVRFGSITMPLTFPILPDTSDEVPHLVQHFPVNDTIPLNTLTFYLRFDRKMKADHQAYRYVKLMNEKGEVIEQAWRHRAFWIEDNHVLVLMIHPGRIKRGIHATSDAGDVFVEQEEYSLYIDVGLSDIKGAKLPPQLVNKYIAVAADRQLPKVLACDTTQLSANVCSPLYLTFNEEIDYGLLLKWVRVWQGDQLVSGKWRSNNGRRWYFRPVIPWEENRYLLTIGNHLGDLAHNRLDRRFEEISAGQFTTDKEERIHFSVK
jgi:hypothetical protein